jgi:diaminopimelate decarboxylase
MLYSSMPPGIRSLYRDIGVLRPNLTESAERFGTPVYVLDLVSVERSARHVESAFPAPWIRLYSVKANDLPEVAGFLRRRGWGASVVSSGEWQHARQGGVANGSIAFEGIGKTDAQLEYAVCQAAAGRPPLWLAIESAQEAARLAELAADHGLGRGAAPPLDILLRLNPDVAPETRAEFAVGARSSKFGMSREDLLALVRGGPLDDPGLRLRGVHAHVGSDLSDVGAWCAAGVGSARLLAELRAEAKAGSARIRSAAADLDTIDFGGGFPLPGPGVPTPGQFRSALDRALAGAGLALPPRPAIEPGRCLVGAAGWLVGRVLHSRPGRDRTQLAVLDAGMTEFIRPALYGSHHRAHPLRTGTGSSAGTADIMQNGSHGAGASITGSARGELRETALEGPVCESTDSLGTHLLPSLRRGDLIAIERAGAYGASFTSRYNGRPPPAEVLLWPDGFLELCHRPPVTALRPASAHDAPRCLAAASRDAATGLVTASEWSNPP